MSQSRNSDEDIPSNSLHTKSGAIEPPVVGDPHIIPSISNSRTRSWHRFSLPLPVRISNLWKNSNAELNEQLKDESLQLQTVSRKKLCKMCDSVCSNISEYLQTYSDVMESGNLVPGNRFTHYSRAIMLLESSMTCFFCELIRIALILELNSREHPTEQLPKSNLLQFLRGPSQNDVLANKYSDASVELGIIGSFSSSRPEGKKKFFLEWIECVTYDDFTGVEPPIRTGLAVYTSNGTYT